MERNSFHFVYLCKILGKIMETGKENKKKRTDTKIRKFRIEKELSQKAVSAKAGISHSAYVKIEYGLTEKIFIEVGKSISEALGVSFYELFDIEAPIDNEKVNQLTLEIEQLKEIISQLKEEQLKDKKKIIELMSENNPVWVRDTGTEILQISNKELRNREILFKRIETFPIDEKEIIDLKEAINNLIKMKNI